MDVEELVREAVSRATFGVKPTSVVELSTNAMDGRRVFSCSTSVGDCVATFLPRQHDIHIEGTGHGWFPYDPETGKLITPDFS